MKPVLDILKNNPSGRRLHASGRAGLRGDGLLACRRRRARSPREPGSSSLGARLPLPAPAASASWPRSSARFGMKCRCRFLTSPAASTRSGRSLSRSTRPRPRMPPSHRGCRPRRQRARPGGPSYRCRACTRALRSDLPGRPPAGGAAVSGALPKRSPERVRRMSGGSAFIAMEGVSVDFASRLSRPGDASTAAEDRRRRRAGGTRR